MNTRDYLSQIERLDMQIKNKLDEVGQLREIAYGVSGVSTKERVKSSPTGDKMTSLVVKIIDYEHDIDKMIDKRCEIISQIDQIEDKELYDVLTKIYVLRIPIKTIASEKKCTERWVNKLHNKALDAFFEKFKGNYWK